MNRHFCCLSLSNFQSRISSNSYLSFHLLPSQTTRNPKSRPNYHLSSLMPLEQTNRFTFNNQKPQQEPSHVYNDIFHCYHGSCNPGDAQSLHLQIIKKVPQDLFLSNSLVNLYAKTGYLDYAQQVFDEMPERNSVSWTCLIAGYSQQALPEKALQLFKSMYSTGLVPTQFTFGSIIRACQDLDSHTSSLGKQIHAMVMKSKYSLDTVVLNSLISMYGSCLFEPKRYADEVFNGIPVRNAMSWNSIISVHAQRGDAASAFDYFSRMQSGLDSSFEPNEYTFGSLIAVSYASSSFSMVSFNFYLIKQILSRVSKSGLLCDLYVGSAMVSAFSRYGMFDIARKVLLELSNRNSVSVNGLMLGLIKQNHGEEATEVFREAGDLVMKNCDSHVVLLSAMAEFVNLEEGRRKGSEIHGLVIRNGLIDCKINVCNGLLNMYSKCGAVNKALRVFKCMSSQDQVSWNSIISGLDQNGIFEEALQYFNDMMRAGFMPSNFSIISSLSSSASLKFLGFGSQVHCVASKIGLDKDISVSNSLIAMYGESLSIPECWKIFFSMPDYDQISWNSMLGILASSEASLEESLTLFLDMMQNGWKPNRVTFVNLIAALTPCSALEFGKELHCLAEKCGMSDDTAVENGFLSLYSKSGDMESTECLFARMFYRRDDVSWNTMVAGYVHNGLLSKAMDLVWLMIHTDQKLDCCTFTTVLSACSSVAALERGMQIHAFGIRAKLESDVVVESALVDMYSKCGRIDYASKVFNFMPLKNEYSWNAMISGYARHGQGVKALELFRMMQDSNLQPDHVTFVGVLSACSHTGLVEQGLDFFDSMSKKYNLIPRIEHYSCVVDLLGRAGEIDKMEEFLKAMKIAPNSLIWRTVLGACCRLKVGTKTNLFKHASEMLLELEPHNPGTYVLISNLYASKGRWEGAAKARVSLRGAQVKKEAGCSWVTLRDGVHVFRSGDRTHPDMEKIHDKLHFLKQKMKEIGYVPQTELAWYDIEAESKEELLSYHSEKLALAFVLTRSLGVPIRIMKNLRVCGDCHLAFCYISKVIGRQIILRDYNRFHHFEDGTCSCGDFW
ncbi:putative pentatricopeptide repeat-containing protein At5g09950 [Phalaenopsis equestris]|uniref:putative pentatricopeptide repeat-containing protein At5g09950 n=1 Tax=Phalaenopsis equestris TaxID=78828 RepID=UPI0009E3F7C5|nr:putative pentatricopeptide repeat-containing protein At5g09950 [Phalaenopsis equestris]XP_020590889.1 putative pentatricopeptide repeat-containing protein At5g09950 [Phalaenopsis equestris]